MKLISILLSLSAATNSVMAFSATPKKIICAFDGTGCNARDFQPDAETDKSISNVLKLHLLAGGGINNRRNDVPGQISLYKRGIGAETENDALALLRQVGGDLSQQTVPMREMVEEVYEEGDSLYIIGFSRGASSARKFVSEISEKGLKTASNGHVEKPTVQFLGCMETVSMQLKKNLIKRLLTRRSGGLTDSEVLGEDGKISDIVKTAVHLLALDDNRFNNGDLEQPSFPPVFMDSKDERVHEAWFSGEHGDVGGTYYEKGIPDAAAKWVQEWMESEGISFIEATDINPECLEVDDFPDVKINAADLDIKPNPANKIHLNPKQVENPSFRPVVVTSDDEVIEGGTVRVHVSVLEHMKAVGSEYVINPNIKKANVVVVGALDKELEAETKEFKELLASQ